MTAVEVFELTSQGGATDFADAIGICNAIGSYCLIGGLAVNCYVEPVYTMDAHLVVTASHWPELQPRLATRLNGGNNSQLHFEFPSASRYEDFPIRASRQTVLGESVMVASLEDVFQGKLWAWSDPARRLSKRKKDELDLIRLSEAFPALRADLPQPLRSLLP